MDEVDEGSEEEQPSGTEDAEEPGVKEEIPSPVAAAVSAGMAAPLAAPSAGPEAAAKRRRVLARIVSDSPSGDESASNSLEQLVLYLRTAYNAGNSWASDPTVSTTVWFWTKQVVETVELDASMGQRVPSRCGDPPAFREGAGADLDEESVLAGSRALHRLLQSAALLGMGLSRHRQRAGADGDVGAGSGFD